MCTIYRNSLNVSAVYRILQRSAACCRNFARPLAPELTRSRHDNVKPATPTADLLLRTLEDV